MKSSSEQTWLNNDIDKFYANLETNCVPVETIEMDYTSYDIFLEKRCSAQRVESDAIGAAELGNPDFGDASPLSLSSAIGNILFVEI